MEDCDCRFIKNQYLIELLRERALQQLKIVNNPQYSIFFDEYSPVIDINDPCNVNIYAGIELPDRNIPTGTIVTPVSFPKSRSIDDLFNILMSNIKTKFILKESSISMYKKCEEDFLCIQFFSTLMITDLGDLVPGKDKMFRIFNIFAPEFNKCGTVFAYQLKDEKNFARIYTVDKKYENPIFYKTIKMPEIDKSNKNSKYHLKIFQRNHKKNRREYEKLE
ncbi:hypothetical protein M9Y10_003328 [Tritrichomonas musculus]|uniref:Uncharacterized protein n=1 Tax=Tritrichomonas musculus TaxID=1915356 RepID=A0ABR2JPH5_9EUKA